MRLSIDEYYTEMLKLVAARSTCKRRQVGAIISTEKGILISMGYNGVPSGVPHCIDTPCAGAGHQPGDNSKCLAIHAEQNAILHAEGRIRDAHTLYCTCTPCFNCCKLILGTPITRIVYLEKYADQTGIDLLMSRPGMVMMQV